MNEPVSAWIVDPANLTPFYSLALAKALASRGNSVRFVTSRFSYDPNLEIPESVTIDWHYFPRAEAWDRWGPIARRLYRAWRYPFDHRSLLRRLESAGLTRPAILHLQWSRLPLFDRPFVRKASAMGIKIVHTVHDVEPLYEAAADMSGLGKVYQRCDALIVHTESNRRDLLERYPAIDVHKVHVIPHGPLQADDCPPDATRSAARAALGIPENARVAMNFGSIKRYKGLDLLVAAMPIVAKSVPNSFLLLAGRPSSPSDAPDLAPLTQHGIAHRADFEFIANKNAWKYYLAADVVVLPYRAITQSGVLLSSMAFGRPSVVTAVGGLPDVVRPGRTGWVVPPESPALLAEGIIEALSDPAKCDAMGKAARTDADVRYSWSAIGKATHDLYTSLLD